MPGTDPSAEPAKTLAERLTEADALRAARDLDGYGTALKELSRAFPEAGQPEIRLAQLAQDGGRCREALIHATEALRRDPGRAWLRKQAVSILLACGFDDAAEAALADPPAEQTADMDITILRAKLAARRRDFDRALALTEAGLAQAPAHPGLLAVKAAVLQNLGRTREARQVLTDLAARGEADTYACIRLGEMIQQDGDPAQAAPHFRTAMEKSPDLVLPFQRLARVVADRGRLEDLTAEAEALRARFPNAEGPRWMLAFAHCRRGAFDAALAQLETLPQTNAAFMTLLLLKADVLIGLGKRDQAQALLQDAAADRPEAPQPLIRLAALHQEAGDDAAALATLERAETRGPANGPLLSQKAAILRTLGDIAGAYAALEQAVALAPAEISPRMRQAYWLSADGRQEEALAITEEVLARQPAHFGGRILGAQILKDLGRLPEAKALMARAPDAEGQATSQLVALARGFRAVGDRGRELETLDRAVRQTPGDPELLNLLVTSSFQNGEPDYVYSRIQRCGREADPRFADARATYLLESGQFKAALGHLKQHVRSPRASGDAFRVARALIGLNRYETAYRYMRRCRRRWPRARMFFDLEFQFLQTTWRFDAAYAALAAEIGGNGAFARQARLNKVILLYNEGRFTEADAALQTERDSPHGPSDGMGSAETKQVQHLLGTGAVSKAVAILSDMRAHDRLYQKERWRLNTISGRLYNELCLNEALMSGVELSYDDLREQMRRTPGLTPVATRLIDRALAEGRLGGPAAGAGSGSIPRTIYQYWDSPSVPEQIEGLMASWSAAPGYDWQLYSKTRAVTLLRAEFGPRWGRAFQLARNAAEGSDLIRLCLLAKYGGIWADADDGLAGDLDDLLSAAPGLLLYREVIGSAVGNNFIAARPQHPVIVRAALLARRSLLQRSGDMTWFKTGPGLFTRTVAQALASEDPDPILRDVMLIEQGQLSRYVLMHHRIAYKSRGGHWSPQAQGNPKYLDLLQRCLEALPDAAAEGLKM